MSSQDLNNTIANLKIENALFIFNDRLSDFF